jgi:hypothetical protein
VDLLMRQMPLFASRAKGYQAARCSVTPCDYCRKRNIRDCLDKAGLSGRKYSQQEVIALGRELSYEELFNGDA